MDLSLFPKLPKGLENIQIVKFATGYYAFATEGRYWLKFYWDGLSATFNKVDIEIDWDYAKEEKDS